jgi:D-specific alpha-keto acid dehydrogenase
MPHPATVSDAPRAVAPPTAPGLTVYGCDPDEAALFRELAPRLGVVPSLTSAPVTLVGSRVLPPPGNRCISVGHKSEVTAPMLRALRDAGVEHLTTRSIGVDHIDLAAAEEVGITVENAAYAPDGVADFTLMLLLMAVRRSGRAGTVRDRELRDLTVGVVGVGRIGAAVIARLAGFGCRILAADTGAAGAGVAIPAPVERVPLAELLRTSDVVSLHVPLTEGTRGLIGAAEIAAMKPRAVLVNTARGGLVDTGALAGALESGWLAGAALDVVDGDGARLAAIPTAIVTPHIAYFTEGALRDTVTRTLENCLDHERTRVR